MSRVSRLHSLSNETSLTRERFTSNTRVAVNVKSLSIGDYSLADLIEIKHNLRKTWMPYKTR